MTRGCDGSWASVEDYRAFHPWFQPFYLVKNAHFGGEHLRDAEPRMQRRHGDRRRCRGAVRVRHDRAAPPPFTTLPREQREAMFQVYSFCRYVDDIADSDAPRDQNG